MTWPTFCINERAFVGCLKADSTFLDSIIDFVSILEDVLDISEAPLLAYEHIYYTEINDQTRLDSVLYADDSVDRDLRRRLTIVLARCTTFSDETDDEVSVRMPPDTDFVPVQSHAIRFARDRSVALPGSYFGLISRGEDGLRAGVTLIRRPSGETTEVVVATSMRNIAGIYRRAIVVIRPSEDVFFAVAPRAFPRLHLVSGLSFRRLTGGYSGNLDVVCNHLGFLNDDFLDLAKESNWDYGSMIARATVDFSDESANTKNNRRAMKQREIQIGGNIIHCTLHTKLSPVRGRIHFHPPVEGVSGQQVIVGILADHLDT